MTTETKPTVLVVEDEDSLRQTFSEVLDSRYDVRAADGGVAALEELDGDVDVVLLDRLMPETSGDEVLQRIQEEGYRCPVAMVTAVEPDFDIVDMGFHDYLVKPVSSEELLEAVENLLVLADYEEQIREYVSLSIKDSTLQRMKELDDLEESEEYLALKARLRGLSDDLGDWSADIAEDDLNKILRMVVHRV